MQFGVVLDQDGKNPATTCEKMRTCRDVLTSSVMTLHVTDNWGPAREVVFPYSAVVHGSRVSAGLKRLEFGYDIVSIDFVREEISRVVH